MNIGSLRANLCAYICEHRRNSVWYHMANMRYQFISCRINFSDLRQKNATSGASVKQQQQMMAPPPMTQSWQPQEPSQMGNHDQILSTNPEDEETAEDSLTRRASASSIITSTTATTVDSNQTMATSGGFDYFEASTRKVSI